MKTKFTLFICNLLTLVLLATVSCPSISKIIHTFNHNHIVCDSEQDQHDTHFHEVLSDCDLITFKFNPKYVLEHTVLELTTIEYNFQIDKLQYQFEKEKESLHAYLRGPPATI